MFIKRYRIKSNTNVRTNLTHIHLKRPLKPFDKIMFLTIHLFFNCCQSVSGSGYCIGLFLFCILCAAEQEPAEAWEYKKEYMTKRSFIHAIAKCYIKPVMTFLKKTLADWKVQQIFALHGWITEWIQIWQSYSIRQHEIKTLQSITLQWQHLLLFA